MNYLRPICATIVGCVMIGVVGCGVVTGPEEVGDTLYGLRIRVAIDVPMGADPTGGAVTAEFVNGPFRPRETGTVGSTLPPNVSLVLEGFASAPYTTDIRVTGGPPAGGGLVSDTVIVQGVQTARGSQASVDVTLTWR